MQKTSRGLAIPVSLAVLSLCLLTMPYLTGGAEPARPASHATVPGQIPFKGPDGAPETAVLFGDPTKPELYVERYRFPKGQKLMPHSHQDAVRTVVVLSGTLYYAEGETFDESRLKAYPAGTFFFEPRGMPHFAWAKDGEVELQLTAVGPTGTGTTMIEPPKTN